MRFFSSLFFCFLLMRSAAAQETKDSTAKPNYPSLFQFATSTGPVLPNHVAGMTEIIPATFFNLYTSWTYFPIEVGYMFGQADGYSIKRQFYSITNDINLFDMTYFWAVGIQMVEYENEVTSPYNHIGPRKRGGWHYGMGMKYEINKFLFIRPEINVAIRPARMLYVGVGIGFSWPTESSSDKK